MPTTTVDSDIAKENSAKPIVTITSPKSDFSYNTDEVINIRWTPASFPVIEIALIPENIVNKDGTNKQVWSVYGGEMERGVPVMNGEYKFTISKQIPSDNYKIRIISDYSKYTETSYFSEVFTIKNSLGSTYTNPVACTMDAFQCPDGSWVGRTGPKCEFVCPK
jgi:hypothetical protein